MGRASCRGRVLTRVTYVRPAWILQSYEAGRFDEDAKLLANFCPPELTSADLNR